MRIRNLTLNKTEQDIAESDVNKIVDFITTQKAIKIIRYSDSVTFVIDIPKESYAKMTDAEESMYGVYFLFEDRKENFCRFEYESELEAILYRKHHGYIEDEDLDRCKEELSVQIAEGIADKLKINKHINLEYCMENDDHANSIIWDVENFF